MREREKVSAWPAFLTWPGLALACAVGPILAVLSIAVGVTDQSFDSIAGPTGVFVLLGVSALASLAVFIPSALVVSSLMHGLLWLMGGTAARWCARTALAILLGGACYLCFQLPTPRAQLVMVAALAASLAFAVPLRRSAVGVGG